MELPQLHDQFLVEPCIVLLTFHGTRLPHEAVHPSRSIAALGRFGGGDADDDGEGEEDQLHGAVVALEVGTLSMTTVGRFGWNFIAKGERGSLIIHETASTLA